MKPTKILLVDDDGRILRSLSRTLGEFGNEVTTTISVAEAWVALSQQDFDVVVSDYMMGGVTGLNFLNTMKTSYPGIIRILLSGKVSQSHAQEVKLREIAHVVMHKPCNVNGLQQTIEKTTESRRPRGRLRPRSIRSWTV